MATTPTATIRLQLARELRQLRERIGMNTTQAGQLVRVNRATYCRYESGEIIIPYLGLDKLLTVWMAAKADDGSPLLRPPLTEDDCRLLHELRDQADQPMWWSEHRLTERLGRFVGFETAATTIRIWEPLLIPGPLQTRGYAEALMSAIEPDADQDYIARGVLLRLERQERVYTARQTELTFILGEHALSTWVGSHEVMIEQLKHLLHGPVDYQLRILPNTVGAHPGITGPFCIFDFQPDLRRPAVYADVPGRSFYVDDQKSVQQAVSGFNVMLGMARSDQDSRTLVTKKSKELEQ